MDGRRFSIYLLKIPGVGQWDIVGEIVGLCFAFPAFFHPYEGWSFQVSQYYLHRSIQLFKNLCPNCWELHCTVLYLHKTVGSILPYLRWIITVEYKRDGPTSIDLLTYWMIEVYQLLGGFYRPFTSYCGYWIWLCSQDISYPEEGHEDTDLIYKRISVLGWLD